MNLLLVDPEADHDISYNWTGWRTLAGHLERWGVDLREFRGTNDAEIICSATCEVIASALAAHFHELPSDHQRWLRGHAEAWRKMSDLGGCRQL